jgi:hypothetical protein
MDVLNFDTLKSAIGLGVAGNFAGHLEQAGEASDFRNIKTTKEEEPKGLFPFYIPNDPGFLSTFPLSFDTMLLPKDERSERIQIEPEVALLCDVQYEGDKVKTLIPHSLAAYNDCSIRLPAEKISRKKNWGPHSKGMSQQVIPISSFSPESNIKFLRLACLLTRDGITEEYGVDSLLDDYSYFYQTLLDWTVEKINTQQSIGPLERISSLLSDSKPDTAIISIGATRYTEFGKKRYLKPNDVIYVIIYDTRVWSNPRDIIRVDSNGNEVSDVSVLCQTVIQ